ncbi:hypothetical protein G6F43_000578 [Rhizopus delemar]|nr:hypothetical protein G6F43_000578 [Rhizopus delemar]
MNKDKQVDVFIIGSGLSGLYAALLLSKIGLSIHIIDNNNHEDEPDEILLLAPRCVQLLNQLDLLDLLLEKGTRHWKLDIYSQGTLVESLKSFETNNPFNYSLSIQKSVVCDALKEQLASLDIFTQPEELIKIQEEGHYKFVYLKNNQVWKSQVILIENDVTNIVRQSLAALPVIQTNTQSVKGFSIIKRDQDTLYIIGHHQKAYITFEHRPSWSKTSIDDEIPIHLALKYIKSMLEPFQIEFGQAEGYVKWKGEQKASELFEYDQRYFFIGPSSQVSSPRGFMDITLYLEAVQNLCWKLALHFHHCASPNLLETFEEEIRTKSVETVYASGTWLESIMNASRLSVRDITYQLNRQKDCFTGHSPYPPNALNHMAFPCEFSTADSETASSFQFEAPPDEQPSPQPATAGCLAPDGKLKPYSLLQLLLMAASNTKPKVTSKQAQSPPIVSPHPAQRKRSNSTNSTLSQLFSVFQKGTQKKRNSTTAAHQTNTRAMSNERWKSIKPNYSQLIDRLHHFNPQGTKFTLLVFCGSLFTSEPLSRFMKRLTSPLSVLYQYNTHHRQRPAGHHHQRSSSSLPLYHPEEHAVNQQDMFSILFISNSTKQEATHYLHTTPPSIVHSTFPYGLDKIFLDHDQQCYKAYGVTSVPEVIVIRPDGYIGTRLGYDYDALCMYLTLFLTTEASAAAVVAAHYD